MKSHRRVLPVNFWKQRAAHPAKPAEALECCQGLHLPTHWPNVYKHQLPGPFFVLSSITIHAHLIPNISKGYRGHLRKENQVAQCGLTKNCKNIRCEMRKTTRANTSMMGCYIGHFHSCRRQQLGHHFWEALCDSLRQKPHGMKFLYPKRECCIAQNARNRKRQLDHHF